MENISEFNKNIAILYEKDASDSKTDAIKELLNGDAIGLEIVKRFVLDRSNRVSVRLLAIIELWNHQPGDRHWLLSIIEDAEEYLFLQKDFLAFLCKEEEHWLEKLTQSQNPQLKREATKIFAEKLSRRITELNLAIEPYRDSLQLESRKLEALSRSLEAEKTEEEILHQQIADIHEKLQNLQGKKQKLETEIAEQKTIVHNAQNSLEDFKRQQQQQLNEVQQRLQSLSAIIHQTETPSQQQPPAMV